MIAAWFNLYAGGVATEPPVEPPVEPPTENTAGELSALDIHYNNADYPYLSAYPGQNIVRVVTVAPNLKDGATDAGDANNWEANTGIAYQYDTNTYALVRVRNAERRLSSKGVETETLANIASQGMGYDALTGRYFVLMATGIQVRTVSGTTSTVVKTLAFTTSQPNPGMLFYHEKDDRFYCSYDGAGYVRIWTPDWVANTLTLSQEIAGVGAEEGATVDYTDNSIWINVLNKKRKIDHNGNILLDFPFTGSGNTGNINEGLAYNQAERLLVSNSDEFYHGPNAGNLDQGNRGWWVDPEKTYNKHLRFPQSIPWSTGKQTDVETVGSRFFDAKLQVVESAASGTWVSPVIDFSSYTMQQQLSNLSSVKDANLAFRFRGSGTAPTTEAKDIAELQYWAAQQTADGWGATAPGTWQSTAPALRYVQLEITIAK